MKALYIVILAIAIVSCGDDTNKKLYNQVMDVHDEVMPKMEDLYNMKKELVAKLQDSTSVSMDERAEIQSRISHIDSVGDMMMDWMHGFNPPEESADKEQTKAYLESEMEKVQKVKEAILQTLDHK
jgi:hypothetical protein